MIISPSILAADFSRLDRELDMINRSAADWVHCDVMDGVFVPNISFGFSIVRTVGGMTDKPLDVHLMIVKPERYISQVRDAGAAIMNVHQEACVHLNRTVQAIHYAGMKAAVTLNPSTPVCMLEDIIGDLDMVLLMSVNPGFGAQKFIEGTVDKLRRLRRMIDQSGSKALIEVDGGINAQTAPIVAAAGADVLVAGSAIFRAADPIKAVADLKAVGR